MAPRQVGWREWWRKARPTRMNIVVAMLAAAALTMLLGFTLAGWTSVAAAERKAAIAADDAVVSRLAPICVAQFNLDPDRDAKLAEFSTAGTTRQRTTYVESQVWATMPGESEAGADVAAECATLLTALAQ